jgi:two-component system, chemotaxis family, protein-glutamate methylesterase/glutaminase
VAAEEQAHPAPSYGRRDLVVVGASAGGVEALVTLVGGLPADFLGTVLVTLHMPARGHSALAQILDRSGPLSVGQAVEGEVLEAGRVLVAPPDRHLIVYDGRVTLSRGPHENGHRPAVDVLFRSAAAARGARVIAVVLSGALDDGAAGMVAVKLRGGIGVCQDPGDALHAGMPRAAAQAAEVDHVLPVAQMPALLARLVSDEVAGADPASNLMQMEVAMASLDADGMHQPERPGAPAGISCPDCNGSLFELHEGGLTRLRCRVGHAWSPESLVAQQSAAYETALWTALRTLEEKAALTLKLGNQALQRGHRITGERFRTEAAEAHRSAELLRELIGGFGQSDSVVDWTPAAAPPTASAPEVTG